MAFEIRLRVREARSERLDRDVFQVDSFEITPSPTLEGEKRILTALASYFATEASRISLREGAQTVFDSFMRGLRRR